MVGLNRNAPRPLIQASKTTQQLLAVSFFWLFCEFLVRQIALKSPPLT